MNTGISISSGVDEKSVVASVDGICKILESCLQHRSEAVTLKALKVLGSSLKSSVEGTSISDCNIYMNTIKEEDGDNEN